MKHLNTKLCPQCNRTLTLDNFYKASSKLDGLQTLCKHCFNEKYSKTKNHTTQLTNIPITTNTKSHALYTSLPSTPFTVRDILKSHKIPYNDRNRSRIQGLLYELVGENLITKTGKLYTGEITYTKTSSINLTAKTLTPRTCIKCNEHLTPNDFTINPNAKICAKCSTQLTTTTTTTPAKLNDDVERITTLLHNELTLLNSKLNGNHDIITHLNTINNNLLKLQHQNQTLIKIFAANCRTIPTNINLEE